MSHRPHPRKRPIETPFFPPQHRRGTSAWTSCTLGALCQGRRGRMSRTRVPGRRGATLTSSLRERCWCILLGGGTRRRTWCPPARQLLKMEAAALVKGSRAQFLLLTGTSLHLTLPQVEIVIVAATSQLRSPSRWSQRPRGGRWARPWGPTAASRIGPVSPPPLSCAQSCRF